MIVCSYCDSVFFLNNNTYTHCLFVLLLYKTRLLCAEIFVFLCKVLTLWYVNILLHGTL